MYDKKVNSFENEIFIPLKIVFLGDEAVGKTSIINRFLLNKFDDSYHTTIGIL